MIDPAKVTYPSVEGAECPYPVYDLLRSDARVYRLPGTNRFLVSRYDDIVHVLRHPDIFSSVRSRSGMNPFTHTGASGTQGSTSFIETDDPEHRRRRATLAGPFTPGRLRALEPNIVRIVDELIDDFIAAGRVELVGQFCNMLPTLVISEMLGFGREHLHWLHPWGLVEASGMYLLPPEEQEIQRGYTITAIEQLEAGILERVRNPTDDVLSELITNQTREFGSFDMGRVLADASTLYRGGIVTTAHLISSAMLLLLGDPGQMAAITADHSRIRLFIEESLRVESPVQWNPRHVVVDTELAGVQIPAGSFVLMLFASANRDESRFEEPACFHTERANASDHLSLGYGSHFCLGAPLARLEARIAFERLLTRLHDLALEPGTEITHIRSASFRGVTALPLTFTSEEVTAARR